MRAGLGSGLRGIDRRDPALDDVLVKGILEETRRFRLVKVAPGVGFVVAKKQCGCAIAVGIAVEAEAAQLRVFDADAAGRCRKGGFQGSRAPRPGVAAAQLRQQRQLRRLGAAIVRGHLHQDVVGCGLCVLDEHVEVGVGVEQAGVEQLELRLLRAALPVLVQQPAVREFSLRIFVQHFQEGMRRRRIEVVVELLDVLAVVSLAVGQPEQPFLEQRVAAVPQGQREAEVLPVVAETGNAVLAPAIGTAARVLVRQVAPGVAVGTVVFTDGAPLPLGDVGTPATPVGATGLVVGQALFFSGHRVHALLPARRDDDHCREQHLYGSAGRPGKGAGAGLARRGRRHPADPSRPGSPF
jgi:hypothetical protein